MNITLISLDNLKKRFIEDPAEKEDLLLKTGLGICAADSLARRQKVTNKPGGVVEGAPYQDKFYFCVAHTEDSSLELIELAGLPVEILQMVFRAMLQGFADQNPSLNIRELR